MDIENKKNHCTPAMVFCLLFIYYRLINLPEGIGT